MLIQEFCRATGLGRDTVRFYVKRGLLTPAVGAGPKGGVPSNRYQVFDAALVERARLIRAAQGLGFTLREIAALAAAYERGGLTPRAKAEVLRAHLAALDARAERLDALRGYLAAKLRWVEAGQRGAPPPVPPAVARDGAPPSELAGLTGAHATDAGTDLAAGAPTARAARRTGVPARVGRHVARGTG